MQQMSQALKSAQQALAEAGQKQNGSQPSSGQGSASDADMGEEFQPGSGGSNPGGSQQSQGGKPSAGQGGGLGGPGRGAGGGVGAQQPLPGQKRDVLVRGQETRDGKRLQRTYTGTPDPTQDRAAYFDVVAPRVRAAEATLNREEIPAAHKKNVRDYFDGIQPGAR